MESNGRPTSTDSPIRQDVKRCPGCGETKPLEAFYRNRSRPDGRSSHCSNCDRARRRRHYWADPEAAREADRQYLKRHADEIRQRKRDRYRANAEALRADARTRMRQRAAVDRNAVFDHYGDSCACCGSMDALSIDHVNGDGGAHRTQIGTGSATTYRWLVANGFPDDFQTLCLPCNKSKRNGERCRLDHTQGGAA